MRLVPSTFEPLDNAPLECSICQRVLVTEDEQEYGRCVQCQAAAFEEVPDYDDEEEDEEPLPF